MIKNKLHKNSGHRFALFYGNITSDYPLHQSAAPILIEDAALAHRVNHVLRLQAGEQFILFDRFMHAQAELVAGGTRNALKVVLTDVQKNEQLQPVITVLLPLLKRDDLEKALYACAELGANMVQLVTTKKSQHKWAGKGNDCAQKMGLELQRYTNIMVAAAEQSKHFAFPELREPIALTEALASISKENIKLFADPEGQDLFSVMSSLHAQRTDSLVLAIGPEGDLEPKEKEMLQQHGFKFCALTPTVLRAHQALSVFLGAVRSVAVSGKK